MAPYDQSFKEEVKSRNDIVDVISEYVSLRRTGKNYLGLCPFHQEKTPSFTVAPEKQIFYCFGCHASGDVFEFVMKREGKDFAEALRSLADRVGLEVPEVQMSAEQSVQVRRRRALYDSVARAQSFYERCLAEPQGARARDYLEKRGLDADSIERFGIGYAPDGWEALRDHLKAAGFSEEILVAAGLCVKRSKGSGVYDRFRDRVVFPIKDLRGRTLGFGARCLDGSEPKYINSPETEVYSKGRVLFALNLARDAARTEGVLVVVEGYMDAISAHQAGVQNVVASLGTALTSEQARQLVQICPSVVMAYDSDAAGQAATQRGLDTLSRAGARVRICEIPDGKDPDDFVRSHGGDAFRELVRQASSIVEYYFAVYRKKFGDSLSGRLQTVEQMVPLLSGLDDAVELATSIRLVADRAAVSEAALRQQVVRARKGSARSAPGHKSSQSRNTNTDTQKMEEPAFQGTPAEIEAEQQVLSLMILDTECRKKGLLELKQELFSGTGALVFHALGNEQFDDEVNVDELVEHVGPDSRALIASMAVKEHPDDEDEKNKLMKGCTLVLKKRRLQRLYAEIQSRDAATEGFQRLFGEYQVLLREIKASSRHSS